MSAPCMTLVLSIPLLVPLVLHERGNGEADACVYYESGDTVGDHITVAS